MNIKEITVTYKTRKKEYKSIEDAVIDYLKTLLKEDLGRDRGTLTLSILARGKEHHYTFKFSAYTPTITMFGFDYAYDGVYSFERIGHPIVGKEVSNEVRNKKEIIEALKRYLKEIPDLIRSRYIVSYEIWSKRIRIHPFTLEESLKLLKKYEQHLPVLKIKVSDRMTGRHVFIIVGYRGGYSMSIYDGLTHDEKREAKTLSEAKEEIKDLMRIITAYYLEE